MEEAETDCLAHREQAQQLRKKVRRGVRTHECKPTDKKHGIPVKNRGTQSNTKEKVRNKLTETNGEVRKVKKQTIK